MCNGSGSSLRKASIHSRDESNRLRHQRNESCLCQALERKVKSAIAEANQVLDSHNKGDRLTAAQLEMAAYELDSVASAGLGKSHPLVAKATQLGKSLRDKATEIKVSAMHVVWIFECVFSWSTSS